MTEFLRLLAMYYMCDSAAALRPMSAAEVAACMQTYERVKAHFVADLPQAEPGSPARAAQNRAAYAGFKAWERDNPALVARLRGAAVRG